MSYAGTYGDDETCRHGHYWRSCAECSEVGPNATDKQVRKARERRLAAAAKAEEDRAARAAAVPGLTDAQRRTLATLADGEWHPGSRTGQGGGVIGTPAVALCRMGLVERIGASRTANPGNPGYQYRLTPRGRSVAAAEGSGK